MSISIHYCDSISSHCNKERKRNQRQKYWKEASKTLFSGDRIFDKKILTNLLKITRTSKLISMTQGQCNKEIVLPYTSSN